MSKLTPVSSTNQGFTLIEVLVTILVLAVGMTGAAKLQMAAVKAQTNEHQNGHALMALEDLADRMRLDSNKSSYLIDTDVESMCEGDIPKACSAYTDESETYDAVQDCNQAELAEFNIWNTFCGAGDRQNSVYRNSADNALFERIEISCSPRIGANECAIEAIYTLKADVKSRQINASTKELATNSISLMVYP